MLGQPRERKPWAPRRGKGMKPEPGLPWGWTVQLGRAGLAGVGK